MFGPVFRYFTVFERYANFGFFKESSKVVAWRKALLDRPSVREAVVPDYAERLDRFLSERQSFLGRLITRKQVA